MVQADAVQIPVGYSVRRATLDDAEIIFEVQAAHDVPIIGYPNTTIDDVRDELVEPGFDPATDGWLVLHEDGAAVAWGWIYHKSGSDNADISVQFRPGHEVVAGWLWHAAQARAVDLARQFGHSVMTVDVQVYRDDPFLRGLAEEREFAPAATFVRMRIDHNGTPPQAPAAPSGVTLRDGDAEAVRRDAHRAFQEGFADHFGFVSQGFDEWHEHRGASLSNDWSMLHVAYLDGEPAAMIHRTNNFVPDENCGYVRSLATRPEYQGRGLGSFLLRHAFAADAASERVGTILHVDTDPKRPALGLYTRNGMRDVLTIDIWRRRIPV